MISDAKRFIHKYGSIIEKTPLQLYCSALLYSPMKSEIRRHFLDQALPWVINMPIVEEYWSPSLHTLEGHSSSVNAVAFSSDGHLIHINQHWVNYKGQNVLWLPQDYRATCFAAQNNILALGHSSGRVTFLGLQWVYARIF